MEKYKLTYVDEVGEKRLTWGVLERFSDENWKVKDTFGKEEWEEEKVQQSGKGEQEEDI